MSGRSFAIAAAIFAAVASAAALVLAFTPLLDPWALDGAAVSGSRLAALADQFHRGPPPCLRYDDRPVSRFDVELVSDELVEAGIPSRRLGELVYEFYARKDEREAAAHARDEVEERLDFGARSGPIARLLVALKRHRLRKVIHRFVDRPKPLAPALPMTEREHAVLDPLWQRSPSLFKVDGVLQLMKRMRVKQTQRELDALRNFVEAAGALDEATLPAELLVDAWGSTVKIDAVGSDVHFTSLGADRAPGGSGDDADLTSTAKVANLAGDAKAAEPAPPTGGPPPASVTLPRAALDKTLENPSEAAQEARLVPAVESGQPVGFKIYAIRKGSIYQRIGLADGDVLTELNGFALTTPDKTLEAYTRLKGAQRFTLSLRRAGKPYRVRIDLK